MTSVSSKAASQTVSHEMGAALGEPAPAVSERSRVRSESRVILRLSAHGNFYAFSILPCPFKLGGLGVSLLPL